MRPAPACRAGLRDRPRTRQGLTRVVARALPPGHFRGPPDVTQVVEVLHPGVAGVSKKELKEKLAGLYKVRRPPRGSQRGRTHAPGERLTRAFAAPAPSRRVPRAGR